MSEEIEKVLGEPVFEDFSENTFRIRRNLLVTSGIAIFLIFNHITIQKADFFGVTLEKLTTDSIYQALILIVGYNWVHFLANAREHYLQWKIRRTGTKLSHITAGTFASELGDYSSDPKQSTLYHWWLVTVRRFRHGSSIEEELQRMQQLLANVSLRLQSSQITPDIVNEIKGFLNSIDKGTQDFEMKTMEIRNILQSKRVEESLRRFDENFFSYLDWKLSKWIIIEFSLPIVVGLIALIMLIYSRFT